MSLLRPGVIKHKPNQIFCPLPRSLTRLLTYSLAHSLTHCLQDSGGGGGGDNSEQSVPPSSEYYDQQAFSPGGGKMKRRSTGKEEKLICLVCGDKALGCNFDAVSCESCKAFFRRNALKTKVRYTVNPLFRPRGVINFMVHNHQGSN